MASSYKSLGAYIDKPSKPLPSIASVKTAIPVFIGYTGKAVQNEAGDLLFKAWRTTGFFNTASIFC